MFKNVRYASTLLLLRQALVIMPLLTLLMSMFMVPERVPGQQASKIVLKTTSFEPGGFIPKRFTCEAADVSPALAWGDPPAGTQSFAIIEDDPDAPSGTFVHWLVYDLPAAYRRLPEALSGNDQMAGGGRQGTNDFSRTGYSGPCPPPGKPHRYFIRLYALDAPTSLPPAATRKELDSAMQGHILGQAELMGRFKR
jgi:Raf kinase inhibitor-like YbhB/YbcL family protein